MISRLLPYLRVLVASAASAKAILMDSDDSKEIRLLKITLGNGEIHGGVEQLQEFGFTARPLPGAQLNIQFIGGNRSSPLVVASDDGRYRPHLEPGESCMYNAFGASIVLKNDGTFLVNGPVVFHDRVTFEQDVQVDGSVQANGDVVAGTVSLKTHVHSGVTPGVGASGPPVGG